MSLHRFGDWTAAPTNARLQRATEPSMTPRLLSFAAVALCVAWVPAPPDPLAADPDVEAVERGPAIGEAELAPYFTSSALKSALSELQAGGGGGGLRCFSPPAGGGPALPRGSRRSSSRSWAGRSGRTSPRPT